MTNKELCDNYLSFLKDKGFRIDIISGQTNLVEDIISGQTNLVDVVLIVKGQSIIDRQVFTIKEIEEDLLQFISFASRINRVEKNKLGVISVGDDGEPIEIEKISDDKQLLTILTIYLKQK